jgi:hypothetical protein
MERTRREDFKHYAIFSQGGLVAIENGPQGAVETFRKFQDKPHPKLEPFVGIGELVAALEKYRSDLEKDPMGGLMDELLTQFESVALGTIDLMDQLVNKCGEATPGDTLSSLQSQVKEGGGEAIKVAKELGIKSMNVIGSKLAALGEKIKKAGEEKGSQE